jgi:hypothetical protein
MQRSSLPRGLPLHKELMSYRETLCKTLILGFRVPSTYIQKIIYQFFIYLDGIVLNILVPLLRGAF